MQSLDIFLSYINRSSFITLFVLTWLSIYFIFTLTILISRYFGLNSWQKREQNALESLLMGRQASTLNTVLKKFLTGRVTREKLAICQCMAEKNATSGLTWLSIISSTSPFIGLFGTVISILDTFSKMGAGNSSIAVIAPAISEALVATGCGIFVAIPAYTAHLLIKRKAYEIMSIINRSADIIIYSAQQKEQ